MKESYAMMGFSQNTDENHVKKNGNNEYLS